MTIKKPTVVFITNYIPIYRVPVYREICKAQNYNTMILVSMPLSYSADEASDALPIQQYKGFNIKQKMKFKSVNSEQKEIVSIPISLIYHLFKTNPTVVISSEFGIRSLIAYMYCKLTNTKIVLSSEEILESAINIGIFRKLLRKIIIPDADAFLAWGNPAHRYLTHLKIPASKIFTCSQSVDNQHWSKNISDKSILDLKKNLNIKGKLFLSAGRLVKRKGFDLLLRAWAKLPAHIQKNNTLMLIGSGELKNELLQLKEELNIPEFIHLDWCTYNELPKYYQITDVFVFPSLIDVWGLVVNEALASGTPVIGSKYAGSSQELITSENTGELIDPRNIDEFTKCLERWILKDTSNLTEHTQSAVSRVSFDVSISTIRTLLSKYIR